MHRDEYRRKLKTPEEAALAVEGSNTIVVSQNSAEPPALLKAVADRVRDYDLGDIKLYMLYPREAVTETLLVHDLAERVVPYSWFVGGLDRALIKKGTENFVPNEFHQVPRLIRDYMDVDVTLTTVSPMDEFGYFSLGTVNDYTSTAARHCKRLVVEVNEKMPRVHGDCMVHISEVYALVENNTDLIDIVPQEPKAEDEAIAKVIAEMVPDGATLQLGIGRIPDAVTRCLENHKDLGIHTEVFTPGMAHLIKKGIVTGRRKTINKRKHILTCALGDRALYDFLDDNPSIESRPVDYTNDPRIIAQNDRMISINSTIEIDLLGQCNSEYLGGSQFSGTGGQLDFVRGAFFSRGGKSILACYSTAHNGEISRIVPRLGSGTVVTTPRADVHYLATEYGTVDLKGKSTRQRALDIIGLAHPKFREQLLKEVDNLHLF